MPLFHIFTKRIAFEMMELYVERGKTFAMRIKKACANYVKTENFNWKLNENKKATFLARSLSLSLSYYKCVCGYVTKI